MRRALASATFPLYVGGFLGPFGGGAIAVLFPQLRDAFDATTGEVAAAIPAYFVPFAVFQLVSGTIGERLGRRRVVRTGYVAYAVASVAAALAPTIGLFIVARAASGTANAFLTPLLLAGLAEVVPSASGWGARWGPSRPCRPPRSRSRPRSAACSARSIGAWPSSRLRAVAVALALRPSARRQAPSRMPSPRACARCSRTASACCRRPRSRATRASPASASSLRCAAAAAFDLGSSARGAVLAGFGVAGMVSGRPSGRLVDRIGRISVTVAGAAICAVLVGLIGAAGSLAGLALLWLAAGAASSLIWAGLNTLTIEEVPANRAGATSVISAFKFAGNAAAPVMWLPLYARDVRLAFLAAGAASALVGAIALRLR